MLCYKRLKYLLKFVTRHNIGNESGKSVQWKPNLHMIHSCSSCHSLCQSLFQNVFHFCSVNFGSRLAHTSFYLPPPVLDYDYLLADKNVSKIEENVTNRKGVGNIHTLQHLHKKKLSLQKQLQNTEDDCLKNELKDVCDKLTEAALLIPNKTHPDVVCEPDALPVITETIGEKPEFSFKPKEFHEIAEKLGLLRTENVGNLTGTRTYYLKNELAEMEHALTRFTVDRLKLKGYALVSVPDLLHPKIIEACGMPTTGEKTLVYRLDKNLHGIDVCLSGTAEMALAGFFMNKSLHIDELPKNLMAVSRCYRAEISTAVEEKGLYRVHQFTKVEMFSVTADETGEESNRKLDEIVATQKELFQDLGLNFVLLDMPSHELGAAAYRKYDIEAWMPGRNMYGEISSASNCTDYQSRRLHITYRNRDGVEKFAHTVNGTGCAVPRMLISILETCQLQNGDVMVPKVLQPYMRGRTVINQPAKKQHMRWIKFKSQS